MISHGVELPSPKRSNDDEPNVSIARSSTSRTSAA
jgi:hypothetical protein